MMRVFEFGLVLCPAVNIELGMEEWKQNIRESFFCVFSFHKIDGGEFVMMHANYGRCMNLDIILIGVLDNNRGSFQFEFFVAGEKIFRNLWFRFFFVFHFYFLIDSGITEPRGLADGNIVGLLGQKW